LRVAGEVTTRRDRNLAIGLSTQRATGDTASLGAVEARDAVSVPGLVDLLAKRRERAEDLPDDLDDVFARYYAENPDGDGLAVFDE